jgi:hypothetical protein
MNYLTITRHVIEFQHDELNHHPNWVRLKLQHYLAKYS